MTAMYESGRRIRDGLARKCRARWINTGMKTLTAAVLLMKAEMNPTRTRSITEAVQCDVPERSAIL